MTRNEIICHNVLRRPWPLETESVDTIVTSPPYWGLRDYLNPEQIGQEPTPEAYVDHMVQVFQEARRVLKNNGTLWLNLADTYWAGKGQSGGAWQGDNMNGAGINWARKGDTRPQDRRHEFIKPKDLVGIPWMVAMALRNDGWYLRQSIIWNKPNPMPESMTDRCTKSYEYIFMLSKEPTYYYDQLAIMQPLADSSVERMDQDLANQRGSDRVPGKTNGRMKTIKSKLGLANKKNVWHVSTNGYDAEFCTACRRYYEGTEKEMIREETYTHNGKEKTRSVCRCGRHDAWVEHFATFPPELIVDCIKAGSPAGGLVLDPFMGAATTAMVSLANGRDFIGLELNPDYIDLGRHRLRHEFGLFFKLEQ